MPSIKSLLLLQVLLPLLRDAEPLCAALTRAPLAGHILSIRILRFLRELQFPAELTRIFETVPRNFLLYTRYVFARATENITAERHHPLSKGKIPLCNELTTNSRGEAFDAAGDTREISL